MTTVAADRQKYIASQLEAGGIVVIFETVAIVHTCDEQESQWKAIICGIPAIAAKNDCCSIHVADLDHGETVFKCQVEKFAYASASEHFLVFAVENVDGREDYYGLTFADATVAKKAMVAVEQLSACVLADEVDGTLKRTKKEISHPTDFKHYSHVATNTPISVFIAALTGTATAQPGLTESVPESVKTPAASREPAPTPDTAPSLPTTVPPIQETPPPPQGAPPPPPPPLPPIKPPPPPLQLPLRGRTRTLPAAPPTVDQGALISELAKFSKSTLRRVNKDTLSQSTNMPDSALETDLTKILKSSLNRIRPKLQSEFTASCVTVCSNGTENGKDDFDGPLFV